MLFHRIRKAFGIAERNLGPEYDSKLITRLGNAVRSLGGTMKEISWGVAGSQEIIRYKINLPGARVTAVGETHMGLIVRGPRKVVDKLATMVSSEG